MSHTKCGSAYLKVQTGCCERIRDSIILDEWRNLRTVSMVLRKGEERNKRLYSTCHTHTYTYAHKSPDLYSIPSESEVGTTTHGGCCCIHHTFKVDYARCSDIRGCFGGSLCFAASRSSVERRSGREKKYNGQKGDRHKGLHQLQATLSTQNMCLVNPTRTVLAGTLRRT